MGGLAAAMLPGVARADVVCRDNPYHGIRQCSSGIRRIQLVQAMQECPQWCWAACIQMAFAKYGWRVPQTDIVQRLFGDMRCAPANGSQIVATVNSGPWRDVRGRMFRARAAPLADLDFGMSNGNALRDAAWHLADGIPLINGALNHATLLTSMTYAIDRQGRVFLQEMIVRDPYPYQDARPSRRSLTQREVSGTRLLVSIRV
ncbi:hypothetical protein A6F65_00693 [Paraurantiacibacter namhicola]|uniref:Peptidase C39-like domain-containing protein n=2 Tax=Paraurantiacibacter namhicola TaxID=645517 RepID=A0A1C7D6D3_9SPHN|nr:hypothetical protein A6F65_00693 [Paraurantiacibacter namhicola]